MAAPSRSEHRSRDERTGRGRSGRPAAGVPERLTGILDPLPLGLDCGHGASLPGARTRKGHHGRFIHGPHLPLAEGTNLSSGSYLSVEAIPRTDRCTADLFLPHGTAASDETLTGNPYSVGHVTDAAVGNRYDETVCAIPGTNPCLAVRYFIHWTVIENYPPRVVTAFARHSLLDRLDAIRRTLVIVR